MSEQDSKASFFKQSGWMVIATFMGGVLMFGVVLLVGRLLDRESPAWADFYYLIKVVNFLGMPAGGLMLVFAHQTAGAVTDESRRELAVCARGIGLGLVALWCGMLLVVAVFQGAIMEFLDLRSSRALWMTLTIALTSLLTPVVRGLLQGSQKFGPLGWTALSDGAIR
ncbi:MAG: O-antigen/teichoic acid export membrane protein, partial [Limisphaerales bacterium]